MSICIKVMHNMTSREGEDQFDDSANRGSPTHSIDETREARDIAKMTLLEVERMPTVLYE